MRLVAIVLATLLAVAAVSCGGDAKAPELATRAAPTSGPTSLAIAAPTLPNLAGFQGTLVTFLREGDLWVTSLDGTTVPPFAVTSGALAAGYAGLVTRDDGTMELFFVVQESDPRTPPGDSYLAKFTLFRVGFDVGDREAIISYLDRPLEYFLPTNAAVSPDGTSVLYADEAGVTLLNIATRSRRLVVRNGPPCKGGPHCYVYDHPRWTLDGSRALLTKTLYEGAQDVIIDPYSDPPSVIETSGGGNIIARWTPDGTRACVSEGTYAFAGAVLVYDIASSSTVDATTALGVPTLAENEGPLLDARGCAWSNDGRLAFGYTLADDQSVGHIAIVDDSFGLIHDSGPLPVVVDVFAWLPDGSGLMFETFSGGGPGLYRPGEGITELPFDADQLLALIPVPTP